MYSLPWRTTHIEAFGPFSQKCALLMCACTDLTVSFSCSELGSDTGSASDTGNESDYAPKLPKTTSVKQRKGTSAPAKRMLRSAKHSQRTLRSART